MKTNTEIQREKDKANKKAIQNLAAKGIHWPTEASSTPELHELITKYNEAHSAEYIRILREATSKESDDVKQAKIEDKIRKSTKPYIDD